MINNSLRHCHQLPVIFHRIQKLGSITGIHSFDSVCSTEFIHLCQIFYQIVFHHFIQHFLVRDHHDIREHPIFHNHIDKFIISVFTFHVCVLILDIQHLFQITGIFIIFISLSLGQIRIIGTIHLGKSIGHSFRILSIGSCPGFFPVPGFIFFLFLNPIRFFCFLLCFLCCFITSALKQSYSQNQNYNKLFSCLCHTLYHHDVSPFGIRISTTVPLPTLLVIRILYSSP